jgi:hypothetical protein
MRKAMAVALSSLLLVAMAGCVDGQGTSADEPSFVKREDGKVYIIDRLGEKWDVTEAESAGFEPGKFQYGIGRNAFKTLDDSMLTDRISGLDPRMRVIGIGEGEDAKAYSVKKLYRHEISNSRLMGKPVAVGY